MTPVPSNHANPLTRPYLLVAALLAAAVAAVSLGEAGVVSGLDAASAKSQTGTGVGSLEVDGVTYEFVTDNCVITDDDFLATGSGEIGKEVFHVSASISEVELVLGASEELVEPEAGNLWLRSEEPPNWSKNADGVVATAGLIDPLDPDSRVSVGLLSVTCSVNT